MTVTVPVLVETYPGYEVNEEFWPAVQSQVIDTAGDEWSEWGECLKRRIALHAVWIFLSLYKEAPLPAVIVGFVYFWLQGMVLAITPGVWA